MGTLLASARASEDVRRQLAAQLAAPKATARMLSALPLVGLLMGLLLGGDPLGWLLSTAPGLICLLGGVALTGLGAWWTHRIALGVQAYT
jgi:tight adherence protein B